ncbi:MAG: dTDP-glucose 4,6-dehydratase [Verrucomicrobiota bacterium]|nr:dTDP-glucose 4,6-dehydratase [Verrucomicrobiota bacterium]
MGKIYRNILVTGGAGFIGSNFVLMLANEYPQINVINLDALTYAGNLDNISMLLDKKNHHFIHGNICNRELVKEILQNYEIDGIINFAAESHVDRSIKNPGIFIETNVMGTSILLDEAEKTGITRFLQVSTDEVYGSLGKTGKFTEDLPLEPNSPYSASKASADLICRAFYKTYALDIITTRCSNNYGPYQFPEKMLPLMINNALNDKALPVYGDGLHIRDWLYVYDHCTAIWAAFCRGKTGEIYNIGGCNEKTNLEVIIALLECLDKPQSLISFVKDRPGHDRRYAIDATKTMHDLDWSPSVIFQEGLEKTIDWYLTHPDWISKIISGEYKTYYKEMYNV